METVHFQFVMYNLERPPRVRLYFNLSLDNQETEPRWFLIPYQVPPTPGPQVFSIDRLEEYWLESQVTIGHFAGLNGFWALHLPAQARVILERFPLLWRVDSPNPLPDFVDLSVAIAADVMIEDLPAGEWFQAEPSCAIRATVQAGLLADQKHVKVVRYTQDSRTVGVLLVGESWQVVNVSLFGGKSDGW